MRIAIISDIHNNIPNLDKFLDWCESNPIDGLIVCGDMDTLESAQHLIDSFPGEIFFVRGNADNFKESELKLREGVVYGGEIGFIERGGLNIAVCHEPQKLEQIEELSAGNQDFCFYGHTHKPWIEKKGDTYQVNPGTLGGVRYQASFALLDTEKKLVELKIVDNL